MGYIESLLIGISLAAIPGPVFFETVRRSLMRGFWSGALISVGEFVGNFVLLLLIFFGASFFLNYLLTKIILSISGGAILIWLAVLAFKLKESDVQKSYSEKKFDKNSLAAGFVLAVTNLITVALFISLAGSYLAQYTTKALAFINIFLIVLGAPIFFFSLAALVNYTKDKVKPLYIVWISRIFGAILLFFGANFLYQFAKLILSA